jgi:hypothetical protein
MQRCQVKRSPDSVERAVGPPPDERSVEEKRQRRLDIQRRHYQRHREEIAAWHKERRQRLAQEGIRPTDSVRERFWKNAPTGDGCWEWQGRAAYNGYGILSHMSTWVFAHRVSWAIHSGEDAGDKMVLHSCDNRRCVNPMHLRLGDTHDNIMDSVERGRWNRPAGEDHCRAKLTWEQVHDIRRRHLAGEVQKDLADEFGVGRSAIKAIIRNRTWRDEEYVPPPNHWAQRVKAGGPT